MTSGNTPNLVLKRMLRYFLIPTTQENIISRQNSIFLLKIQKKNPLQQVPGGETPNLVLKRMLELFLKVPQVKKILELQNQKRDYEIFTKRKFRKPKIKP